MIEFELQLDIIHLNMNFQSLSTDRQHQFLELVQDEYAGIDDVTSQVVESIVTCMYLQSPTNDLEDTLQPSTNLELFSVVLRNISDMLNDFLYLV